MSQHSADHERDDDDAAAQHAAHAAPSLPVIADEAGETPSWVPALGVGLFALFGLLMVLKLAISDSESPPAPPADEAVAAAPADEVAPAPVPAAPAEPVPAPAAPAVAE